MRRRRQDTPIVVWVAFALLAGAAQIPLAYAYREAALSDRQAPVKKRRRAVSVTMRPQRRPAPKPEPKVEPEEIKGRIVMVREPEVEEKPVKRTKYLANANRRVVKEKKARPSRRRRSKRLGAAAPEKVSKVQSPQSRSLAESASPKVTEKPDPSSRAIKAPKVDRGDSRPHSDLVRNTRVKALLPALDKASTLANLQTLTGASSSDEPLLDVQEEGSETLLNTRRFQHWDFFNTMRDRIQKHWHPAALYLRRDPTGKVYGVKDRLTVLRVTLDRRGKLERVQTVRDSGIDFLDLEARRAFSRAAPFVNPPRGLVDQHGRITFQFSFVLELSTGRFRFFRSGR